MQGIHSFTRNYRRLSNRPLTSCLVSAAWLPKEDASAPPLLEFDALWDTGATRSVISQEVAAKLELLPEGTAEVFHAQGSKHVLKYFVNLGLPNKVQVIGVQVLEGVLKGCDVLIGMDIITRGDFALTNLDDVTMLSFQMPSVNHIDFVKILEESERKGS